MYSAGIIEWTKEDVKKMDQKKKKRLSPCAVGFIRDQTLSGCTYQEVKEVVGL